MPTAVTNDCASLEEGCGTDSSDWRSVQGVGICFEDVTVTLAGGRRIVRGATGRVSAGHLTALLGPSGAGKTTFLDALAGRTQAARLSGQVWYDGQRPTPSLRHRLLAYVEQEDALVPNLTVLEMLRYTCELRSPPGTPADVARARAEQVLGELNLQSCRNTLIGGSGTRAASGGQRRRVSIGVALVCSPSVLLLDECTSGLDSRAALAVVDVLRAQADRGLTVLASVHQPSERLLARFDSLLMAAGGRLVYQGLNGLGAKHHLQASFPMAAAELDAELPLPDWLLDCLEQAVQSGELDSWQPEHAERTAPCITPKSSRLSLEGSEAGAAGPAPQRRGPLACCGILLKYRMWADYRNPVFVLPRVLDKLGLALLMGTLFLGMGNKTGVSHTNDLVNCLFMWILLPGFSAVGFIPALMLETQLFVRERHMALYPIISYLVAKLAEEVAIVLPVSVVLAAMVYFMAALSGSFLLFWLPYLASMCIGVAVAYVCAAVSPTMDICILLLAGYVIAVLFFTGLIINWADIPGFWKWFACASYMRYAWAALMVNQFEAQPRELAPGTTVLAYFGLEGKSAWAQLGIQCSFFFGYLALAWAALAAREALPRWMAAAAEWWSGLTLCSGRRETRAAGAKEAAPTPGKAAAC